MRILVLENLIHIDSRAQVRLVDFEPYTAFEEDMP